MTLVSNVDVESFIGRTLGTVTIVKMLGKGVSGVVFIGFQRTLKRQVAVKVMAKSPRLSPLDRDRFRQEAEIIAGLSHPNIIPIYEMGEEEDCFFQVMQIVKGEDLDSKIKRGLKHPIPAKRTMPVDECVDTVLQVLDGLGYAHEEGIVHQDIKPANILLDARSGRPLIADFGIAVTQAQELDDDEMVVGSPLYIAPEQVRKEETDPRADVYSVGVMLFQMIAGKLPLTERDPYALLVKKMQDPASVFTCSPAHASRAIDRSMERILLRAMEPDREDRYENCEAFSEDLRSYRRP